MSKLSDGANVIGGILISAILPIASFLLHLFFCYLAYQVGPFWKVVATFCLPILSEIYWLIMLYAGNGFLVIHTIVIVLIVAWILGIVLLNADGTHAEARRQRKQQKRQQDLEAERAARDSALQARYDSELTPAAAAAIANRQAIDQKIAERRSAQTPVIIPQQPVSQEEQLRRRAEMAERRCRELSAELERQKGQQEAEILSTQIDELERTLAARNSTIPEDGVADLKLELMEKKAKLFDLQRKQK